MWRRFTQLGFTLTEMLVYLAIFTIVTTAAVGFLLSLDRFIDQYRLETMLYRSGTNAMEQIILSIRQAESIDLLNTTEDTSGAGRLTVTDGTVTTEFLLTGNELHYIVDSTDLGDLTSGAVTVTDFIVYYYPDEELVRVRLDLVGTLGTVTKTQTLYAGAVIRGAL